MFQVVDLEPFLNDPDSSTARQECLKVVDSLRKYSVLAIRDPRVSQEANDQFLDLMEQYYQQPTEVKKLDSRPEYSFQVGVTPEFQETPKCSRDPECIEYIKSLDKSNKPGHFAGKDPKWRYFWRIGSRPKESNFAELNADPVYPSGLISSNSITKEHWQDTMNGWGNKMYESVLTLAEMMAIGFKLPRDTFTNFLKDGAHLLAPTGSNLSQYGMIGTTMAGFHYDLNFLTIHGKSRYPGLNIWTRQGQKVPAKIPNGCLLVQAGKQLEYLTGSFIKAGYHEVVVNSDTYQVMKQKFQNGETNLWRVSSTLFSHVMSDQILEPLPSFHELQHSIIYPPILAGEMVQNELRSITLKISN